MLVACDGAAQPETYLISTQDGIFHAAATPWSQPSRAARLIIPGDSRVSIRSHETNDISGAGGPVSDLKQAAEVIGNLHFSRVLFALIRNVLTPVSGQG